MYKYIDVTKNNKIRDINGLNNIADINKTIAKSKEDNT